MKATKKLPVGIDPKTGRAQAGSDFLVPCPPGDESSGFIGIQSGKRCSSGMLAFLGVAVSAMDIRSRVVKFSKVHLAALTDELLESYSEALGEFKIGNVIAASYAADGALKITKIAEMVSPTAPSWLP